MKPKVTGIIPAHNEEKSIAGVIKAVKKHVDEVLVVLSKNSKDRTGKISRDLGLTSKHTEIETEMDMKCFKKGYKILEVPSMEKNRKHCKSRQSRTP